MAAVAMAVGATAGAARVVVDKVGEARASRASNWRRVSAVATWWHGLESGAQSRAQGRAQGHAGHTRTPRAGIQLGAGEHSWRQVYNSADRAVCPIGATRL